MASFPSVNPPPEYFLLKLNTKEGVQYIFTEITSSFNGRNISSFSTDMFEDLMNTHRSENAEVAVLPPPGDFTAEWTFFAVRKQSGKKVVGGG